MKPFTCQNRKESSISIEKLIVIGGICAFAVVYVFAIHHAVTVVAHESYDECNNLITGVHEAAGIVRDGFLGGRLYHDETIACTKYIDENPNATGQDVLDHLNLKIRTIEEIIDGPINSNLLDTTNVTTRDITDSVTNLPYYKECVELGSGADISVLECMSVVADNPSYTGQEIIDAVELNKNTQVDKSNILDRTLRP